MALQKMGPYKLMGVVGRGGMGTVFRATDPESGKTVAVKALAPTLTLDEHFRQRFESEIQALIKLTHPNIVRLLSYGQDEGNLYFAMELIDGESLFGLQKSGYLFNWREVLRIGLDVSAGLRHAHDRGIIHRDLKPGNLLRDRAGTTKITDFGIAKSFGEAQITGEGNVLGTLDFMSPEQARGESVTVRSDLYSLGAVMYALMTRRPPFAGDTIRETLEKMVEARPRSIIAAAPDVPPEIEEVIFRLLSHDPKRRIATAYALSNLLIEIQRHLRSESEASTAIVTKEIEPKESDGNATAVDDGKATGINKATRHDKKKKTQPTDVIHDPDATRAEPLSSITNESIDTSVDSDEFEIPGANADYFSEVTDQDRKAAVRREDRDEGPRNVLPWVAALALVLAAISIGVYYNVIRRPSADKLWETIAASQEQPISVNRELDQFLDWYPQDRRAHQARQLKSYVSAIQLRNQLKAKANLSGPETLFEIERQFLEHTSSKSWEAFNKLSALITLHTSIEDLDPRSRKCLEAATAYQTRMQLALATMQADERKKIRKSLLRSQSVDDDEARKICNSIVALYGDEPWAADLVKQARTKLAALSN